MSEWIQGRAAGVNACVRHVHVEQEWRCAVVFKERHGLFDRLMKICGTSHVIEGKCVLREVGHRTNERERCSSIDLYAMSSACQIIYCPFTGKSRGNISRRNVDRRWVMEVIVEPVADSA